MNPAVTAGMAVTGKVKPVRAILYVIAQCAGAAAGSGLLKAFTPDAVAGKLGVTGLGKNVTALQGFGIEFFLGFVLVFVVCGVSCYSYLQVFAAGIATIVGLGPDVSGRIPGAGLIREFIR